MNLPSWALVLAQTESEDGSGEAVLDPARPLSDWLIQVLDLDPEGTTAVVLYSILEPLVHMVIPIAVAWLVLVVVRRLLRSFLRRAKVNVDDAQPRDPGVAGRRNQRLDALGAVLGSVLTVVVWVTAFLVILANTFGISVAPFLAGAGILGVALGFGAQDLVKDFLSGLFMLVEDQYAVGDVVDVGDATGEVEKISLRTTRLRDVQGTVWHFPNGEIRRVGNLSQEWSRALLDILVSYGTDIDLASEVIVELANDMSEESKYQSLFLATPEVWGIQDMAADGVVIRLVIKTVPGVQWGIGRELRRRIKIAFDRAGIEIPIPQRSVWIRSDKPDPPPVDPVHHPSAAVGKGDPTEGQMDVA